MKNSSFKKSKISQKWDFSKVENFPTSKKPNFFRKVCILKFPQKYFCFLFRSRNIFNFGIFWLKFSTFWNLWIFVIFYFPKIGLWKMTHKMFCTLTFFENQYFFINSKAKVAPTSLLSKTPKNMTNGSKLKKLFHFFVRGVIN